MTRNNTRRSYPIKIRTAHLSAPEHCAINHPELQRLLDLRAEALVENYLRYVSELPRKMFGKEIEGQDPYRIIVRQLTDEGYAERAGLLSRQRVKEVYDGEKLVKESRILDAFDLLRLLKKYQHLGYRGADEIIAKTRDYLLSNARRFEEGCLRRELLRWNRIYTIPMGEVIEAAKAGNRKQLYELIRWDPHWFYIDWIKQLVLDRVFAVGSFVGVEAVPSPRPQAWTWRYQDGRALSLKRLGEHLSESPRRFPQWRRPGKAAGEQDRRLKKEDERRLELIAKVFVRWSLRSGETQLQAREFTRVVVKQLTEAGAFEYATPQQSSVRAKPDLPEEIRQFGGLLAAAYGATSNTTAESSPHNSSGLLRDYVWVKRQLQRMELMD